MSRVIAVIALCLLLPVQVLAQNVGMDNPRSNREVLAMGLYPPDIIMRHQQELGITPEQRKKMLALVKSFQSEVSELQWNMQGEQQQMKMLLRQDRVDEKAVVPQVERVLEMESRFKLAHFKLLIGIKNELTEAQIEMIKDRMKERRAR